MSTARIDDCGLRIDFCFDLIIVSSGERPSPVISPSPGWFVPQRGLSLFHNECMCNGNGPVESRTRASCGLLRYYIYDAINLRDMNDN